MSGADTPAALPPALRTALALACLVFHAALLVYPVAPLLQRAVHLSFALVLVLAWRPLDASIPFRFAIDRILIAAAVAVAAYYAVSAARLEARMEMVDPVLTLDKLAGAALVLLLLETVRRCAGWNLLSVLLLALAYAFWGRWFPDWTSWPAVPDILRFSGFTLDDAAENLTMTTDGIFGFTTATSVDLVFYFVVFGAFYTAIGGSRFLTDSGLKLAGRSPSAPARAAIVASGLMGSVSGSAVANVASTGVFTIPLMRRSGYPAAHAAAVEAMASTGGQLMPPIMGVAAFVMAERLEIPYPRIALAALIPSAVFYLALFLTACRPPVAVESEPALQPAPATQSLRRRLHLLLPLVLLITLFALGKPASFSAAGAAAACLVLGCLLPASHRPTLTEWRDAINSGIRQATEVAVPIAAIGIVITVAVQSGLALRFSVELVEMSAGQPALALLLVILGCLVLGMGLPTVAAYVLGATLLVPILLDLGFSELPAHFFVFYYCVLSMVTPPVALASAAAAGLAGASFLSVSLHALRFGLATFFLPLLFVFEPALLAQGSPWRIVAATGVLLAGTLAASAAISGHCIGPIHPPARVLLGIAAFAVFASPLCAPSDLLTIDGFPLSTSLPGAAAAILYLIFRFCLLVQHSKRPAPQPSAPA